MADIGHRFAVAGLVTFLPAALIIVFFWLLPEDRSARSAKIQALNQIRHLSFTAPEQLRQRLAGVSRHHLAARAAALRPATGEGADPVVAATKTALRLLGRRVPAYMARRLAEGRSKPEVIRVLKRYVAREACHRLPRP